MEGLELPSEVGVSLRWVDEDISLFIEALTATASVEVHQRPADSGPSLTREGRELWGER